MIAREENTIYLTRGDETSENNKLTFSIQKNDGQLYKFKPSDEITFVVVKKKGYTMNEIIKKDFLLSDIGYKEETEILEIPLTSIDTEKFPIKNKPVTYWYEIIINKSVTLLGFDTDGAKKIIVYPSVKGVVSND